MRDQDTSVGIIVQVFFQPVAGLEVQVVGGFVEQQQVGFFQQQFGQGDAHLPAAGEFFRAAMPIGGRESQPAQHHSHLRLERISVAVLELGVDGVEAVGHRCVLGPGGIDFPHLLHQAFHLLFHGEQIAEHGHALRHHRAPGKRQAVLRQVAGRDPFGKADLAVVEGFKAGQGLEQSGLARAVRAHQAHAIARRDEPVEIFEQQLGAEAFSGR